MTLEFLCTLQITDIGIQFRLFGEEFSSPWKDLSLLQGFNSQRVVDVDHVLQDFDRQKFWKEISGLNEFHRPRTNDIQYPTLRFLHKCLGFSMFPRPDTRPVWTDDLKLLYANVKRAKVSPVKFIVCHWLEVFTLTGDVECTSLVTRIA